MNISIKSIINVPFVKVESVAVPVIGQHIPALDGLRGVAILVVLIHHLWDSLWFEFGFGERLVPLTEFGWIGVDLFFVLSGFLITGILYDSKASSHYFKNFYMRRVLRIFPLYYGTLLVILLLRAIWPEAGVYGWQNPAWMWVYLTNVVIALKGSEAFGFVDHFWSLAIEEHFYFVWPLAVLLLSRRRLMQLSVALIFITLGLRIALVLGGISPKAIYVLTPTRLDALCTGALLTLAVRGPGGVRKLVGSAWLAVSVSGLAIMALIIIRHTTEQTDPVMQTIGYSLLAVFFGALLILSIASPLQHVFNAGILRWFGKYSYGIYVWHPILFILIFHTDLARTIRNGNGTVEMLVTVVVALGVMFAVTLLSWHCWENQFLKLKRYFK